MIKAVVNQLESQSLNSIVAGFSFAGRGQNMGLAFVRLKHWDRPRYSYRAAEGACQPVMC